MPAPRTPISSMSLQVISTSDQVGFSPAISRTRGTQWAFSFFVTSSTMLGLEVAPGGAALDRVGELLDGAGVVPVVGGGRLHHPEKRAVDHRHAKASPFAPACGAAGSQFISQA
jgi:hypothetical protein